jgi:hypothetical protein
MMAAEDNAATPPPVVIREESEETPEGLLPTLQDVVEDLDDRPTAAESPLFAPGLESSEDDDDETYLPLQKKRRGKSKASEVIEVSDDDELFDAPVSDEDGEEKKKKHGIQIHYNGLNVSSRVLQLFVKRLDKKGKGKGNTNEKSGPGVMEGWVQSTQAAVQEQEVV